MPDPIETVIIGGGQAGLSMSYHLAQLGREHVILERGRIAERWRSERWDSLSFQFPNWMVRLPGYAYEGAEPDGFMGRNEVVRFIAEYARRIAPPIRCGIQVTALQEAESGRLLVQGSGFNMEVANVVVATGPYQEPSIPAFSAALSPKMQQVTANRYTNPRDLPPGRVLVVGSGGSGCQIAVDLLRDGREVYLSVGRHRLVPRRYRGRDFGWWQETTGALDVTVENLAPDTRAPLLTGVNGGEDVNLRSLAKEGVTLVGGLRGIQGDQLFFAADLEEKLIKGDETFGQFTRSIDAYVLKHNLVATVEPCPDAVAPVPYSSSPPIRDLDVRAAGITSVIWATGYQYDFGWIGCPVFDASGKPAHLRGVTAVPGLYFLGLPRLHKIKSTFLWGVGEDAAYLAQHIATRT